MSPSKKPTNATEKLLRAPRESDDKYRRHHKDRVIINIDLPPTITP